MITSLIQIGIFSIQPLLSLYVSQLTDSKEVALLAGITFSATGVGSLMFARTWGKLGDSIGYEKILAVLLIIAFIFTVPQAFVTELWQLVILRFLFGIATGGLIPITTALIRREAPIDVQGELMGYNTSFRFFREYYRTYVWWIYQWIYWNFLCIFRNRWIISIGICHYILRT